MEIRQPKTDQEFRALLRLLQTSLRPADCPFAIADEYPIVLKNDRSTSYCIFDGDTPIAHAHLWIRQIRHEDGRTLPVGLIGNVATDATRRGQGLMRHLFQELDHRAQAMNLKVLILWSDLDQFYQNLGYASLGEEIRFKGVTRQLAKKVEGLSPFALIHPDNLSNQDLGELLTLRPKDVLTIERTPEEFRTLLSIPATSLFVSKKNGLIDGYAMIGKGMDMWGVIHEWGCRQPEMLIRAAFDIGRRMQFDDVMLLAPSLLPRDWIETLTDGFQQYEKFPMAWGKTFADGESLKSLFIWGLDSI